jgi:hypothetical protein
MIRRGDEAMSGRDVDVQTRTRFSVTGVVWVVLSGVAVMEVLFFWIRVGFAHFR